jgi:hypothetical protein
MLMVQCNGCGAQAFVSCVCPPGHDHQAVIARLGGDPGLARHGHHDDCPVGDLGSAVECACCDGSSHLGLSHDLAAHLGHPNMVNAVATRSVNAGGHLIHEPDHDGEHGKDNDACAVCRPVTVTVVPGDTSLSAQFPSIGG